MTILKSKRDLQSVSYTLDEKKVILIQYTNWRGETSLRKVIPEEIYFGSSEWHPESQWLMRAYDLDKEAYRDFALKDMTTCSIGEC
jgi:predicted DNA-binding transcriptional regulator YafY